MAKTKSPVEKFLSLTDDQRAAEVARLEKPLPPGPDGLPGKPLTPSQRKRWDRIQTHLRRGRPTVGKGAQRVLISVEKGLLEEADAYARRHNVKRSQLIATGLRLAMSAPQPS